MKKTKLFISGLSLLTLTSGVLLGISIDNQKQNNKEVSAYSTSSLPDTIDLNDSTDSQIRSYYSSLNSLSTSERQGNNLLKNLKTILKTGQKYLSYDSTNAIWDVYCIVDRDWNMSPASSLPAAAGTYNSSTNKITNYKWGNNSSTYENPYLHALYYNRNQTPVAKAYGDHGNNSNTGINREHIWPKGAGFDENGSGGARGDIMHLWAAHGHTNNKHSNYFYGYVDTTQSYKDEASDFSICAGNLLGYSKTMGGTTNVFEPQDSDKGDIARACFYMVARYNYLSKSDSDGIDSNNPNLELVNNITDFQTSGYESSTSTTGKLGIIQDLLEWNRLDPPDEFEIHRNNLCYKNFTNNRNPFIDFPEWAEYIWGKSTNGSYNSTSTGYATPSSDSINDFSDGSVVPPETKTLTSISINGQTTSFTVGDTFSFGGTVTAHYDDSTTANVTDSAVFSGYNMSLSGNQTVTVSYTESGVTKTTIYNITVDEPASIPEGDAALYTGALTEGDYVIYYNGKAMKNTVSSNRLNYTEVTPTNDVISSPDASIIWHIAPSSNYWTIYNASVNKYAAGNGTKNQGALIDTNNDYAKWTVTGTSTYEFVNKGNTSASVNSNLRNNGTYGFACYSDQTGGALSLYKVTESSGPTLTSISLDTTNVQKTFNVGDTFNYSGLVVTAHYDDDSSEVVTPTSVSSPDMSSSGNKTITVTYEEQSATYQINVKALPVTTDTYQLVTGDNPLLPGDQVIIAAQASLSSTSCYVLKDTIYSNYYLTANNGTINNQIISYDENYMTIWTVKSYGGGYAFYNGSQYLYGYSTTSGTKTYRNLGLSDTLTQNGTDWTITKNSNSDGYDVVSNGLYLEYYSSKFTTYTGSNNSYPINFYKKVVTAYNFSQTLLDNITCDSTGSNAPTLDLSWSQLGDLYNSISSNDEKNFLKTATYTVSGSVVTPTDGTNETIALAISKYDIIVGKYNYTDFLNRKGTSAYSYTGLSTAKTFKNINNQVAPIIVVTIALLSVTTIGIALYQLKKKKQD